MEVKTLRNHHSAITFTTFGGQLLSCKFGNDELLYLSSKAKLDGSKAIRGGIPICWPWFGKPEGHTTQHGVARTGIFKIIEAEETEDRLFVKMQFTHDKMVLTEAITVADKKLRVKLHTDCSDAAGLESTALHTYFNIQAKGTEVTGLDSVPYFDKIANKRINKLDTAALRGFNESPIDRVFETPRTDTLRLVNST